MRAWAVIATGLAFWAWAAVAAPVKLYVSLAGSDTWSGRAPAHRFFRRASGPYRTLARAAAEVAALKQNGAMPEGVTVYLRGGRYELALPLRLGTEHAGSASAPVEFRAYRYEQVTLSGGREVRDFVPWRDGILKADLAAAGLKDVTVRQLYFEGALQRLARYPNWDPANPLAGGYALTAEQVDEKGALLPPTKQGFYLRQDDLRPWPSADGAEVMIFPTYNWWTNRTAVRRLDRERRWVELAGPASFDIGAHSRFYFQNVLEELDQPGEWYADRASATLCFWPPTGSRQVVVTVPILDTLIELLPGAAYIGIRGLTLEHWRRQALKADDTEHCRLTGCTVHDGTEEVSMDVAAIQVHGGHSFVVEGNDIHEVGSHAIQLDGGDRQTLAPGAHVANNNYIYHPGVFYKQGVGIVLLGVGNRASHNLIHDCPRWGIYFNGNDHVVELNHIRHVCTETDDTGAVYAYANAANWSCRGSVVRHNYIHDAIGYGRRGLQWLTPYYAWGVYLDGSTSGVRVEGNILVRCSYGGGFNNGSQDNVWVNNVFVDNDEFQFGLSNYMPPDFGQQYKGCLKLAQDDVKAYAGLPAYQKYAGYQELAKHPEMVWKMQRNVFSRNILCWTDPTVPAYRMNGIDYSCNTIDTNIFWHAGQPIPFVGAEFTQAATDKHWERWRELGNDHGSVVADPLFAAAARDDYRLRPESPAFKLGFEPIPVDRIGPYPSPARASWPIREAAGVRERPIQPMPPVQPLFAPTKPPPLAVKRGIASTLDGRLAPGEWDGGAATPMPLAVTPDQHAIMGPACQAWLRHDDTHLFLAARVPFGERGKLVMSGGYGQADGIEMVLKDLSAKPPGGLIVLQGTLDGKHCGLTKQGNDWDRAQQLGEGSSYAVVVGEREWTCEWSVPLASVGITPAPGTRLAFNLGIRRMEEPEFILWVAPFDSMWVVENGGVLLFE